MIASHIAPGLPGILRSGKRAATGPDVPCSRGVAAIELLLAIPILLIILFIIGTMLTLGPARLLNVFQPNAMAYQDATAAATPQFSPSGELDPIPDPMLTLRPELPPLPNRVHVATATQTVTLKMGNLAFPPVTLTAEGMFTSPTWASSSWPVMTDTESLASWVETYAEESKESVEGHLELAPAWPP